MMKSMNPGDKYYEESLAVGLPLSLSPSNFKV